MIMKITRQAATKVLVRLLDSVTKIAFFKNITAQNVLQNTFQAVTDMEKQHLLSVSKHTPYAENVYTRSR